MAGGRAAGSSNLFTAADLPTTATAASLSPRLVDAGARLIGAVRLGGSAADCACGTDECGDNAWHPGSRPASSHLATGVPPPPQPFTQPQLSGPSGDAESERLPSVNRNIRLTQLQVLAKVREQREYRRAKEARKRAESELLRFRARQKVLGAKSGSMSQLPPPALPPLERPTGKLPRLPNLQPAEAGPATFWELDGKIDFHQHCSPGDEEGLQEMLAVGKAWGVERSVLLSLRLPRSSRQDVRARNDWVLEMSAKHPEIVPFVTVIEEDEQAPRMFAECLERGARGLKLIGWHSDYIKQFDYDLRHPSVLELFRLAERHRVPVLIHLWVGFGETKRNYLQDLEAIMSELPQLRLVLAHFGLGFDPATFPGLVALAERHRTLYFDTSLYGSFCELWFSRASNQAEMLRSFVRAHPRQVLFGTDVFGSRRKQRREYTDAMRASIGFLERESIQCAEFRHTAYFTQKQDKKDKKDKYGPVLFTPMNLHGLGLAGEAALLRRIFRENAEEILQR